MLAIGAHPDDVEINCGGTLKLLRDQGCALHIATMTLGDGGSKTLPPDQIRRLRRQEAERAAALLGAKYHYVGSNDFAIFNDDLHNRRVTAVLREIAPDIVLTHQHSDYMLDHETTSVLVRNACFYAPAPNYDTRAFTTSPALSAIPHLYYFDVMEGVDLYGRPVPPQFYTDISEQIEFKTEMLACHTTQREWLRAQHGIDEYLDSMRAWSAKRGTEAAAIAGRPVTHAEAFRQHLGHAYPRSNLLRELLGNKVIANPAY